MGVLGRLCPPSPPLGECVWHWEDGRRGGPPRPSASGDGGQGAPRHGPPARGGAAEPSCLPQV